MNTNMLALASDLTDKDLLARLQRLATTERETSAELVAHLAVLETRPSVYAAQGYGSLFNYCTRALRLSEDAACSRIAAARTCRRFPAILDALALGTVSLTSIRLLGAHLTPETYDAVLAKAAGRSRREIETLVADLAPRPDVPTSIRKLPSSAAAPPASLTLPTPAPAKAPEAVTLTGAPVLQPPTSRPIVQATAPERYRVQFTLGKGSHDKLRRLQDLLRREIPSGDPGLIFDRALTLLLEKVEKAKWGATSRPAAARPIRSGTDKRADKPEASAASRSRYRPPPVERAVWRRDDGQCAFVGPDGLRCTERTFLEFHHLRPYAHGGPATIENLSLRCRRHNQYEAQLVFGKDRQLDSA